MNSKALICFQSIQLQCCILTEGKTGVTFLLDYILFAFRPLFLNFILNQQNSLTCKDATLAETCKIFRDGSLASWIHISDTWSMDFCSVCYHSKLSVLLQRFFVCCVMTSGLSGQGLSVNILIVHRRCSVYLYYLSPWSCFSEPSEGKWPF